MQKNIETGEIMTDAEAKASSPHAVLETAGVGFDPGTQHLDLSKEEKRRTTALMMAINAYQHLIIKDADYLREAYNQARANNGPAIRPATMDAMVEAAIKFDMFIAGQITLLPQQEPTRGGAQTEEGEQPATDAD
jgi:hypothetical protein